MLPTAATNNADFTSIIVSQARSNSIGRVVPATTDTASVAVTQQQQQQLSQPTPPDVILQTLPDVVTSFFESNNAGQTQPPPSSVASSPVASPALPPPQPVIEPLTTNFLFGGSCKISDLHHSKTELPQTELTHLADLESITDFLGMNNNNKEQLHHSELNLMDCTWESGSSSSGSHFEFPEVLSDINDFDEIMERI